MDYESIAKFIFLFNSSIKLPSFIDFTWKCLLENYEKMCDMSFNRNLNYVLHKHKIDSFHIFSKPRNVPKTDAAPSKNATLDQIIIKLDWSAIIVQYIF